MNWQASTNPGRGCVQWTSRSTSARQTKVGWQLKPPFAIAPAAAGPAGTAALRPVCDGARLGPTDQPQHVRQTNQDGVVTRMVRQQSYLLRLVLQTQPRSVFKTARRQNHPGIWRCSRPIVRAQPPSPPCWDWFQCNDTRFVHGCGHA